MATIDLHKLEGQDVVVYFGGTFKNIDAYTFANTLIALVDAAYALNSSIDPVQEIEIQIVALADGSFKASLKRVSKGLGDFLGRGVENLFWAYVAFLLIDKLHDDSIVVKVEPDQVVVEHGADRVVVPKSVFEHSKALKEDAKVQKDLSKAFEVLEHDKSIKSFGLTSDLRDKKPLVTFIRSDFPRLAGQLALPLIEAAETSQQKRMRTENARLIILKTWLRHRNRKWAFEWNGVPMSAVISDRNFWTKLSRREILIGAGDALDVLLKYEQLFDEALGVFVNNHNSFDVVDVIGHIGGSTSPLPGI